MDEKKHEMPETDAFDRIVTSGNEKQHETKTEQKTEKMNENLNLVEILKDVPEGTEFHCSMFGDVRFVGIDIGGEFPILIASGLGYTHYLTSDGKYCKEVNAECILFPSADQRDWSKFEIPLKDKELVWCWDDSAKFKRVIAFYDAKNKSTFGMTSGYRNSGGSYEHYERFSGEWPEWAKEAVKKLED